METESKALQDETFRDHLSTVTEEGKRSWIYAKKPKGRLYRARTVLSVVYLFFFFSFPFIKISGEPLFLFNVLERKFNFFGVVFWPQDFFIFGIGMLAFILFVVLFTIIYGRIFCGWICPQTIFMEMVFRKIEYFIEGGAIQQKRNNSFPIRPEVIVQKGVKHIVFFILAFLIANTFLAYIIGIDELFKIIQDPIAMHIAGFSSLLIFTFIFYAVYAWFREQVCLIVCPYGRLQGVMLDKNSIVVAYDYLRGEPRGKIKKNANRLRGDCVNCFQCVRVCPTGIDIRNGTQLECINCTACIDACDHIMGQVNRPKGLIRYASENGIAKREKLKINLRIISYSIVLVLLLGVLAVLLVTRKDIDAIILRTPGMLYQKQLDGKISNLYNIKIVNKTHNDVSVNLKLENGNGGIIKMVGKDIKVEKESKNESEFFIILPLREIKERKTKLVVGVYVGNKRIEKVQTSFLGPTTINK